MNTNRILAVGAHPDDVEFGCGGILVKARSEGVELFILILSRGESGSHGSVETRIGESKRSAAIMDAKLAFLDLGGDAHLEYNVPNTIAVARHIRALQPGLVLAPHLDDNQHPDHWKAGKLTRDACRLARYGGFAELNDLDPHAVGGLCFYEISPMSSSSGGRGAESIFIDISDCLEPWFEAMNCHASQMQTRNYAEVQQTRARLIGTEAGCEFAMRLIPNDPLLLSTVSDLFRTARRF